ncbi:hypothetical protein FEM48_Zijuj07G0016100 [Ziziphus jujuba var. spinosa]|uniref:Armadillo-like repeats domain-containing protein n=1 Tax=Ziziphus jujuba var. spinosa TaxID=714518 RepID=A0A978V1P6_ZIZJJ|nr:hypothetical protein FEM48_Zijuj07G0016100 [Ziziphus jujuba var. spinosa]
MALASASFASQLLPLRSRLKPKSLSFPFPSSSSSSSSSFLTRLCLTPTSRPSLCVSAAAASKSNSNPVVDSKNQNKADSEEGQVEVEEDLPWIQDKALDIVEFTGSVTQAIPGPRVGSTSLPWILALPLAYAGVTFVIAFVKTVKKFTSPREKRRRLVNKNAMLCKSIDDLYLKGRDAVEPDELNRLAQKNLVKACEWFDYMFGSLYVRTSKSHVNGLITCLALYMLELGFGIEEILRKYIRYALNEKPFNPDLVADLIQLRKASGLDDSQIAGILNEISRRIVQDKGPVVMNISGYSEKGFKRKLAVQALFGKVFYLSELPEFCSKDSSLVVKEIFGVADEDAIKLRMHTLSEAGDMDSLEKMVDDSDSENSEDGSSDAP